MSGNRVLPWLDASLLKLLFFGIRFFENGGLETVLESRTSGMIVDHDVVVR